MCKVEGGVSLETLPEVRVGAAQEVCTSAVIRGLVPYLQEGATGHTLLLRNKS